MRCPNCETENREGAKFCDQCGFPLTGTIARYAEQADQQERDASVEAPDTTEETQVVEEAEEARGVDGGSILYEEDRDLEPTARIEIPIAEEGETADDALPVEEGAAADDDEVQQEPAKEEPAVPTPDSGQAEDAVPFEEQRTQLLDADLSGFDRSYDYGERLVDPGYREPTVDWRDGGTMKMPAVDGEGPARSRDYLESAQIKRSNRPKIIAGAIAGALALVAIVAFATYQMQLWGGIAVPNVIGMTEADAASVLEEHDFAVRSTQVKSDDTEGLVLVMDPDAGSRAEEGSEVVIHISTAREVPAIVGKSHDEAAKAFEGEGFTNIVYEKEFSDEPAGTVLSVKPEVGTRAKSAQEIIAKVAEPYVVPDVAGMYLQEAQSTVEHAGLTHTLEYVNTIDYPDGQIIGSNPEAGTQVKGDTVVSILVARARGPELEELTRGYLAPGNAVTIGINNYAIESLDSVEYIGNETVAYTMTARPFTYILGETVSISARQITGQVVWNEDNTIASIS